MTRESSRGIELHAGMPKAGSSSIQAWLASRDTKALLADEGVTVCVIGVDSVGAVSVRQHEGGHVNSGAWVVDYMASDEKMRLLDDLVMAMRRAVDRFGRIILSSEAFVQPLWRGDERFLAGLGSLAEDVPLRVSVYVRPQHTALEAAWRQWGFRTPVQPAAYIRKRSRQLHYRDLLLTVRRLAARW